MMVTGARPFVLAAWLLQTTPAAAHDFWIEPSSFLPGNGQAISVDLKVGEVFVGDSVPRYSASIERFALIQAGITKGIPGSDGAMPAGIINMDAEHPAMIVYDGGGGVTRLEAPRFEAYLRAHGLEWVITERAANGETAQPVRERFHRHAKALLRGRQAGGATHPVVDQTLELVPDGDPAVAGPDPTAFTVHWQGAPLPGCLVIARNRADPANPILARSDRHGRIRFQLGAGVWLLQAVWMRRGGWFANADWESDWASVTFLRAGQE